ncbi:8207_t:CDS:2 [Diversispora eburnea]|uniref:8207_t:CDS:1 n=2 Tax=Diversisporales TaxID=214509 RepID=A0A9N8YIK6_9GLOM|nr:8207_t:CDS:2 [Diversispora eburnea]CAG8585411.1 13697_t:CDS:2 [Dentiscutata erythropus]
MLHAHDSLFAESARVHASELGILARESDQRITDNTQSLQKQLKSDDTNGEASNDKINNSMEETEHEEMNNQLYNMD